MPDPIAAHGESRDATKLARRLVRETPWQSSVGCSFLIAFVLLAFASFIGWMEWTHRTDKGPDGVVVVFSAVFGLVGLVMLFAGIHQKLAMRTKETIVEVEERPLRRGTARQARVMQEGPVSLKSLRMNLVCLETITKIVQRRDGTHRERYTKQIADHNVLDQRDVVLAEGEQWERDVTIDVPADAEPSGTIGDRTIEWKLEVWGVVRGNADFMHPFVVDVQ